MQQAPVARQPAALQVSVSFNLHRFSLTLHGHPALPLGYRRRPFSSVGQRHKVASYDDLFEPEKAIADDLIGILWRVNRLGDALGDEDSFETAREELFASVFDCWDSNGKTREPARTRERAFEDTAVLIGYLAQDAPLPASRKRTMDGSPAPSPSPSKPNLKRVAGAPVCIKVVIDFPIHQLTFPMVDGNGAVFPASIVIRPVSDDVDLPTLRSDCTLKWDGAELKRVGRANMAWAVFWVRNRLRRSLTVESPARLTATMNAKLWKEDPGGGENNDKDGNNDDNNDDDNNDEDEDDDDDDDEDDEDDMDRVLPTPPTQPQAPQGLNPTTNAEVIQNAATYADRVLGTRTTSNGTRLAAIILKEQAEWAQGELADGAPDNVRRAIRFVQCAHVRLESYLALKESNNELSASRAEAIQQRNELQRELYKQKHVSLIDGYGDYIGRLLRAVRNRVKTAIRKQQVLPEIAKARPLHTEFTASNRVDHLTGNLTTTYKQARDVVFKAVFRNWNTNS
ncbi:hypothetical protein CcaCcLH18_10721 [Colletotrichum camelliae]|nr:hypothetical protein CcaCcLH18_10721 [Colletotrichum camelliae]